MSAKPEFPGRDRRRRIGRWPTLLFRGAAHCRLFCGPKKGALGKCGNLCFRVEEFAIFTEIHKVLAMEFVREMEKDPPYGPAGDDDVQFARV